MKSFGVALRVAIGFFVWLFPASLPAETYYLDGIEGNDSAAGTGQGASAWRSWSRLMTGVNSAQPGDTFFVRPGRYYAADGGGSDDNWRNLKGPVSGTSEAWITVSVDTDYSGDVEVVGSMPGGFNIANGNSQDRTTDWAVATDPDGHTIYYSVSSNTRQGLYKAPGVAFQPGAACSGGSNAGSFCTKATDCSGGSCEVVPGATPTFYEILYSQENGAAAMPSFTPGQNQVWISYERDDRCESAGLPWACCTGAGAGTCSNEQRVYVQTASGEDPGMITPPVEFPYTTPLEIGGTGVVSYVRFTNNNNGRKFYFWWATVGVLLLWNVHHVDFEDFDIAYNSSILVWEPGSLKTSSMNSGSGFPRNLGGPMYLITHTAGTATTENHHVSYRRGKVHGAAGDECWHISCDEGGTGNCQPSVGKRPDENKWGSHLFEDLEVYDCPWEVPNGTPVYTGGQPYSWPPSGYSAGWSTTYATHYSPLGGGSHSPGPWIIQTPKNIFRRLYLHDNDGIISFETSKAYGQLLENSVFDGAARKRGGSFYDPVPVAAVGTCTSSTAPTECRGFTNSAMFRNTFGGLSEEVPGNVYRNNIIRNGYGQIFENSSEGSSRWIGPQVVNNTFHIIGDADYVNGDALFIGAGWGTSSSPAIFKNNIVVRDLPSTYSVLHVIDGANVEIDNNLYGPENMQWQWKCGSYGCWANDIATWKTQSGQDVSSPDPADPLFVSPGDDLRLSSRSSPAVDTGLDLSDLGFFGDIDDHARPVGASWDIGAHEYCEGDECQPAPPPTSFGPSSSEGCGGPCQASGSSMAFPMMLLLIALVARRWHESGGNAKW